MSNNAMPGGVYQTAPSPSAVQPTNPNIATASPSGPGLLGTIGQDVSKVGGAIGSGASAAGQWLGRGVANYGQGLLDAITSGAQGTSPIVPGNYQLAPPDEQAKFQELGVPSDQTKYVALRDPGTGQYQVYYRNPNMNENGAIGIGRVLQYSLPGEGIPTVASGLSKSQQALQDFKAAGVTPSIPTVGQGIGSRLTANLVSRLPVAGGPVVNAVNRAASDTGQAAKRIASTLGTATNAEEAGNSAMAGINQAASDFKQKAFDLYNSFRQTVNPNQQVDLTNTMTALRGPMDRFPTAPALGERLTNPTLMGMYNDIRQSGGKLTFGELSELRSNIGKQLSNPSLVDDISRSDLKSVYAGITQDLGTAAQTAGPQATQAFNAANSFYKNGIAQIDQLEGLLKGSPEQTFSKINTAAGTGNSANAGLLRTLKDNLPPDQFNDVGSAIIRRMGQPSANAAGAGHGADSFSVSDFATNWNRLSPSAKDTLFGPQGVAGGTRDALETLVRVAGAQKFVVPSGHLSQGIAGALGLYIAEHGESILSNPQSLLYYAAAGLGLRLGSTMLMNPTFARWLYTLPRAVATSDPAGSFASAVGRLGQAARVDPRLSPAYNRMLAMQQQMQQQQSRQPPPVTTPQYPAFAPG